MNSVYFCSTTTNCPAPPPRPEENTDADGSNDAEVGEEDTPRKRKTKSQQEKDEQFNKLLKIAQTDDHPVELALAAISKQMQRSLNEEEQDELLDELRAVASSYFREKRKSKRSAASAAISHPPVPLQTPPPPPLRHASEMVAQPQPQQAVQNIHQTDVGHGDILFEMGDLAPMQQYNMEIVRDSTGGTYMKM